MKEETNNALNAPLDSKYIKTRKAYEGGPTLSYIEGHHAIREANRIFGHTGWSKNIDRLELVQCEEKTANNKQNWYVGYLCTGSVRAGNAVKQDVGFGQGIDKDLGRAHESAIKEAVTDMMKRCLKDFGDPFGLALYDKDKTHVSESVDIKAMKKKLWGWLDKNEAEARAFWNKMKGTDQEKADAVFLANSIEEIKV